MGINSVFADPNNIPNKIKIMPHISNIEYQQTFVRAYVGVCDFALLQKAYMYAMHFI